MFTDAAGMSVIGECEMCTEYIALFVDWYAMSTIMKFGKHYCDKIEKKVEQCLKYVVVKVEQELI